MEAVLLSEGAGVGVVCVCLRKLAGLGFESCLDLSGALGLSTVTVTFCCREDGVGVEEPAWSLFVMCQEGPVGLEGAGVAFELSSF